MMDPKDCIDYKGIQICPHYEIRKDGRYEVSFVEILQNKYVQGKGTAVNNVAPHKVDFKIFEKKEDAIRYSIDCGKKLVDT